jgi:quercetin dioxygenase-like cupin family protein
MAKTHERSADWKSAVRQVGNLRYDGVSVKPHYAMQDEKSSKETKFVPAKPLKLRVWSTINLAPLSAAKFSKKTTGKVTVFAFDAEEGLSEHTSPFDALVQVLEGEVEITIAGKPHRLTDGHWILMPWSAPRA